MKIDEDTFSKIKAETQSKKIRELAEEYGVSERTVSRIKKTSSLDEYRAVTRGKTVDEIKMDNYLQRVRIDHSPKRLKAKYDELVEKYIEVSNKLDSYRKLLAMVIVGWIICIAVMFLMGAATHAIGL